MKNVLLLVHDDAGQEARLQAALDVTRALQGHLTCIDVTTLPVFVDGIGGASGAAQMVYEEEIAREKTNRTKLAERIGVEDVSWEWIDVTGDLADSVLEQALLADVIVVNRQLDASRNPDMISIAKRILMHSRKPVIAVPENLARLAFERALIAWDGSGAAGAAMRAAVPLLKLAAEVELFSARPDPTITTALADLNDPAVYLSRHGVHPVTREEPLQGENVTALVLESALEFGADYLVAGAYGHGIVRTAIGGVTRELLRSSEIPLFLAH